MTNNLLGETYKVSTNTELSRLTDRLGATVRTVTGRSEHVEQAEGSSRNETDENNVVKVQFLAGKHECSGGNNKTFHEVLEHVGEYGHYVERVGHDSF